MKGYNRFLVCMLATASCFAAGCSDDGMTIGSGLGSDSVTCDVDNPCTSPLVCKDGRCVSPDGDVPGDEGGEEGKPGKDDDEDPGYQGNLPDKDGDGIPDIFDSCDEDFDEDGLVNCEDPDSDGDGIPDSIEKGFVSVDGRPTDTNGDGTFDFLEADSDGNGIPDKFECHWGEDATAAPGKLVTKCDDTDGNGVPDFADMDNDGDGVPDVLEIFGLTGSNTPSGKVAADCDGDGQLDDAGTLEAPFVCKGTYAFLNPDSDGDTIKDGVEGLSDSDGDGILDIYSLDSDGDGIPDSEERCQYGESCTIESPVMNSNGTKCYTTPDCDGDGILDTKEIYCANLGKHARYSPDVDGDGSLDSAEIAVAQAMGWAADTLVCNADKGVKDVFDFYFVLPYKGETEQDTLLFTPAVSKLDVVFNMDVTGSMGAEVAAIQSKIRSYLIPEIRKRVSDSAFGVSAFADFPVYVYGYPAVENALMIDEEHGTIRCQDEAGGMHMCSYVSIESDMPWWRYCAPSTDDATVQAAVDKYHLHQGYDAPEASYEALWMIANADNTALQTAGYRANITEAWKYLDHVTNSADRWGGAGFRQGTLPMVIHITDTLLHDAAEINYSDGTTEYLGYSSNYVMNPHYSDVVHEDYKKAGIRVLSILRNEMSGGRLSQLVNTSMETNAIVPVCAFQNADGSWKCGENQCCLETNQYGQPSGVAPYGDQCVLSYGIRSASTMNETIVDGVDALVKYGTYEVATRIRGFEIPGKPYGTECFIKKVESLRYIPPALEPEKSCNPTALPYRVDSSKDYNDGFNNFAPGTSLVGREGAKLEFAVIAENDTCVEPTDSAQVFYAEIDVINPTTGLVFGTRKVSIIVPAGSSTGTIY